MSCARRPPGFRGDLGPIGSDEQIFGVDEQVLRRGRPYIGLHYKAEREGLSSTFPIRSANGPGWHAPHPPSGRGLLLRCCEVMTSDNGLSLILRRLDEIERKIDRIVEELRMPTAIGYSVRRGNLPRKVLRSGTRTMPS